MNWNIFVQNVLRYSRFGLQTIQKYRIQIFKTVRRTLYALFVILVLLTAYQISLFFYHKKSIEYDLSKLQANLSKSGQVDVPKQIVTIYDRNQNIIGKYNSGTSLSLSLKQCSETKVFTETLIASEDRDFLQHSGISIKGMLRAFVLNLVSLQIKQGGGTITQQLARNLFTDRTRNSISRKIYETIIAIYIETKLNKSEIICMYMNKAYFGQNSYGVEEAARYYFNKSATKLTYAEASLLVGVLPAPSLYNPIRNTKAALNKQKAVMNALVDTEVLNEKSALKKINEFRALYQIKEKDEETPYGSIAKNGANKLFQSNVAPEINEYVLKYLTENLEGFQESENTIKVYTSIDVLKQRSAKSVLNTDIDSLRWSFRNESKLSYKDNKDYASSIQGVIVSLNPYTGEILASSGGTNAGDSYRNMVRSFYMKRQVGSVLKGFLYCVALEEGTIHPNSILKDEPVNISGYKPKNWYGKYLGEITIAEALQQSVNTVAVTVLQDLGVKTYANYLKKGLGLSFSEKNRFPNNLTLALGSADFSPLEVAVLYSEIVNGGKIVEYSLIQKIVINEDVYFESPNYYTNRNIFSSSNTSAILQFLKSVFAQGGTAAWVGNKQKKNPSFLNFDIAGKSGTVENDNPNFIKLKLKGARDVWFVGLTPEEVTVVWFGHEEGVPIPGSGSSVAASTWARYAQNAIHPDEKQKHFTLEYTAKDDEISPKDSDWDIPDAEGESVLGEPEQEVRTPENDRDEKDNESNLPNSEKIYISPDEKPKG
ncbi:transglycosylase domain-containing protein [Leptospira sp. 96542]|nr:transglycosylase domain-containing protein [Leptospira sp. 96542]